MAELGEGLDLSKIDDAALTKLGRNMFVPDQEARERLLEEGDIAPHVRRQVRRELAGAGGENILAEAVGFKSVVAAEIVWPDDGAHTGFLQDEELDDGPSPARPARPVQTAEELRLAQELY